MIIMKIKTKDDYYKLIYILLILNTLIFQTKTKDNIILNDIIIVGEENYRYINFVTTSKGVMFLETSPDPGDVGRIFYGINPDGSSYFKDSSGKKSYIYKKNANNNQRTESEIGYFILNSNNSDYSDKEYLISLSQKYVEVLDIEKFEDNIIKTEVTEFIFSNYLPINQIWSINNLRENNLNYFYLGYIIHDTDKEKYNLYLNKYTFEFEEATHTITANAKAIIGIDYTDDKKLFSCYLTKNTYYICFFYYYSKVEYETNKYYLLYFYILVVFDKDLKEIKFSKTLEKIEEKNNTYFFKAVHLRNEIGCLIYYLSNNQPPMIKIMELDISHNIFISCINSTTILNDIYSYNTEVLLNDLIKISDEKICFSSSSNDKTKLIIVIISFYNNNKFTIRYYILKIYDLLKYKFLFDIKLHLYNNNIAFASSVCPNNQCTDNSNEHFSILMFFSYPNSTTYELNIIDYLSNNIENYILFNISEKGIIDNNIFGYIIYGANIISICDNELDFKINETEEYLTENSIILKDKLIKLELPLEEYNVMTCKIEYQIIITEQNYEIFNNYTDIINHFYEDNSEDSYWKKQLYYGKVNNYNIILNNKILTNGCDDICSICYSNNTNKCITCKSITNFEINSFSGKKEKKCLLSTLEETTNEITNGNINEDKINNTEKEITDEITNGNINEDKINNTEKEITDEITNENINEDKINNTEKEITDEITNENINEDKINSTEKEITDEITTENKYTDKITNINEQEKLNEETTQKIKNSEQIIDSKTDDNLENLKDSKEKNYTEKSCSNEDILHNNCNNLTIKDEQIIQLYDTIKNEYIKKNKTEGNIIITKNVIFEITDSNEQKTSINNNVSSIDLGECENKLKEKYNILKSESLIIFKTDSKSEDLKTTYVQYEIYNPNTLEQLDLSICQDYPININIPILLDSEVELLYKSLNESGYNLFDANDSFYNDVCTTFKTENNTDITIEDRRKHFYESNENLTLCQIGCSFQNYNSKTKKSNCKCRVVHKNITTNTKDIQFYTEKFTTNFLKTLKHSNFLVLKCYKLIFDISKLNKNIGFIIMTILLILSIIFIFIHYIKYQNYLPFFINSILKNKFYSDKKDKNKKDKKTKNNKNIKNIEKNKDNKNENKIMSIINKKSSNKSLQRKITKRRTNSLKVKNKKNAPPPRKLNKSKTKRNNNIYNKIFNVNNSDCKFKNTFLRKKNKLNSSSILKLNKINIKPFNSIKNNKINHKIYYNDQELNTLEYNIAIEIDKRTYSQYYWSLLKKKHPILFTFYPNNDYNLTSIKLSLIILSFSLYFTINGFFFSDETMHKIFVNKGSLNFLERIPQILYSVIITTVINTSLKLLSLSELTILSIKKEKNLFSATNKTKIIIKQLKIKFIIFFILNIILNLFFWYFISCFCAVYINTQILLIKDTLYSLSLSMIYPFGLYLLPGFFRIPALRAKNKDKDCLYKISCLIALI